MNFLLLGLILLILLITGWALLGGDEHHQKEEVPPERQFRRRATDLEIERAYPEGKIQRGRRASDQLSRDGTTANAESTEEEDIRLPYSADEIISDTSRFRIYKRTLLNAEIYARKGDFDTAISLFKGVNERINDEITNKKIDANIEYLKKFKEINEKQKREKENIEKNIRKKQASEIRVSIDGPLTIPDKIQIGLAAPIQNIEKEKQIDTNKIVEEIISKLMETDIFKRQSEYKDRERQLKQYINEVVALKEGIQKIAKTEPTFAQKISPELLDGESGVLEKVQEKLREMEERLNETKKEAQLAQKEISRLKEIAAAPPPSEASKTPSIIEAKYTSPIPITLDPRPIEELLERLPVQKVPDAVELKPPKNIQHPIQSAQTKGTSDIVSPESITPGQESINRNITTKETEEPDDFELFSEYLKGQKDTKNDELSDEDIFEKILKGDKEKIQDAIEIVGENKDQSSYIAISEEEYEHKRREEERFYERFLKHEKRVRKELPILKVTYDFSRLPDELSLSKDKNILEYQLYKYKPLLEKANEFIKKRRVRDAINYYRTVMAQNIPPEFKAMIRKNINDLNEYLEKYLSAD
ncbi:MAG: hypothetical protein N2316_07255 [Spirochaetes bacterium]|nr:hypothetical protein [Spirochaetota bacterium]